MSNKYITITNHDESLLEYVTTTFGPINEPAANCSHPETKQDMTEAAVNGQVKSEQRERVYLHSIGRFSKLRKLQMRTDDD